MNSSAGMSTSFVYLFEYGKEVTNERKRCGPHRYISYCLPLTTPSFTGMCSCSLGNIPTGLHRQGMLFSDMVNGMSRRQTPRRRVTSTNLISLDTNIREIEIA